MSWLPDEAREMLDALAAFAKRLGRDPTFNEVNEEPNLPDPNNFAYYFGSFTNAIKEAHRKAFVYKESPKIAKTTSVIHIFTEEEERSMSRRAITDEEYVVSAIRLQKELGHFPNICDIRNDFRAPSPQSYERRFGGDWKVVKACVRKRATDLNITEDNFERVIEEHPELFAFKKPQDTSKPAEDERSQPVSSEEKQPNYATASVHEPTPEPETAPEPESAAETKSATIIQPDELLESSLDSEPMLPEEMDLQKVRLISLLPKTRITNLEISGYAMAFKMQGSIPLPKSISGIPILKRHVTLQFVQSGQVKEFPAIRDDIFYIVDRNIALAARETGREVYDLLIPEKYDKDGDTMMIHEFSII